MAKKEDDDKSKKSPKDKKSYVKPMLITGGSLLGLRSTTFAYYST